LAKEMQKDDKELTEYLGEIHKASDRATALTRQLLSFSRQQIIETKTLSLNDIVEGLNGLLKRLIPESIAYQFIGMQDLGMISGDKGQLEQAIINLVVNARDAMPEGGKLTIETENVLIDQDYVDAHPLTKIGRFVLIRISDTGIGISAEMQDRIFEPFFTTKPEGSGTGLGLSVYFGIVKQHDGFAHLYSEEGKGSEFRTYLPIVERKAGTIERRLEGKINRGHELILLVEDEEQVSKLASTILSRAGYKVILAENGEVAVQKFKENADKIALVLLDVVLPKLGGRDVMKAIHEIDPCMAILFTSGYSKNGIHTNFILEDDLLLLQKPYSSESLLRRIRETIDSANKSQ
ncbi:MAG: two-component system cell cycle sensor histidine kinase/response regulator CckA, partial [Candidatus Azotimanducaceae bacterium]